jgi:hypothetical protein
MRKLRWMSLDGEAARMEALLAEAARKACWQGRSNPIDSNQPAGRRLDDRAYCIRRALSLVAVEV